MDRTEQKKDAKTPVVSPLANEKTYGERVYTRVFDWGLNYWTNLIASAGFSQWIEHGDRPIKMMGDIKPREIQQRFAGVVERAIGKTPILKEMTADVAKSRSMAVARSLTLLTPGFFIMIPSVWLGAKFKPQIVEWFNKRHYGEDAMDDPSLQARHQAIAAEERPTFLGTFVARCISAVAVQLSALTVGSEKNFINRIGEKVQSPVLQKLAIDPTTKSIGAALGGAVPKGGQETANKWAAKLGMTHSNEQIGLGANKNTPYDTATKDFGRFVVADTVYTLITTLLIRPCVKLIKNIPGMSYKPKVAANSPTLDGDKVKVPANRYADTVPLEEPARPAPVALDKTAAEETPSHTVSHITKHNTIAANDAHRLAQA